MSSSSSLTMKTIQKRLCTVLPRVRSNSVSSQRLYTNSAALSLFDSSSPPPSRPVLSSSRFSIEGKPAEVEGAQNSQHHSHSHPPFSLALTQPQSSSGPTLANTNPQGQYALFPYASLTSTSCVSSSTTQPSAHDPHPHPRPKRQRLKYQLDVGAYGIPKRCRAVPPSRRHLHTQAHVQSNSPYPGSSSVEDLSLSVQVGEDAYFVRDNAMGVADGVGGWSKSNTRPTSSPSALFARRLMHYCSAEVESAAASHSNNLHTHHTSPPPHVPSSPSHSTRSHIPPSRPQFSFTHHLRPRPAPTQAYTSTSWKWSSSSSIPDAIPLSTSLPASFTLHDVFSDRHQHDNVFLPNREQDQDSDWESSSEYEEDLEQDLSDSLEELSEGLDVLQILERAYDQTLKTYDLPSSSSQPPQSGSSASFSTNSSPSAKTMPSSPGTSPVTIATEKPSPPERDNPLLAGSSTALLAVLDHAPKSGSSFTSTTTTSDGSVAFTSSSSSANSGSGISCEFQPCDEKGETTPEYDAVIKIAHVGDCMGMLVRGEEIAWRSEEMWWDFNTPVQLGPSTSTSVTPRNSARIFTIPVRADDILILASDGLSDNLWDEDVLDEVVRFRRNFLSSPSTNKEDLDSGYSSSSGNENESQLKSNEREDKESMLRRKTLAGMLSEALCSRARRVSERKTSASSVSSRTGDRGTTEEDEVPFARRAREVGKRFIGGKNDDISVVVAVISPKAK